LTIKTYKTDLIDFLESVGVSDSEKFSITHLKRWVVEMQKRPKYSGMQREMQDTKIPTYTVNKRIRSVKAFQKWVFSPLFRGFHLVGVFITQGTGFE